VTRTPPTFDFRIPHGYHAISFGDAGPTSEPNWKKRGLAVLQTQDIPTGQVQRRLNMVQSVDREGRCQRMLALIHWEQNEVRRPQQSA